MRMLTLMGALLGVACEAASPAPAGPAPVEPACVDEDCERVAIAAGPFTMGCNDAEDDQCDADERPTHEVTLPLYHLDRTEVTVARYQACIDDGGCTAPVATWPECNLGRPGRDEHPVNCMTREQAAAFCAWSGGRLPTEAEWEKAARGEDLRVYPWGNQPPDCDLANFSGCHGDTLPVGSLPAGMSPYGALDMAGNLLEWTADLYGEDYYSVSPPASPTGPEAGTHYVARGGSHAGFPRYIRTSIRDPYLIVDEPDHLVGIRCAYDP